MQKLFLISILAIAFTMAYQSSYAAELGTPENCSEDTDKRPTTMEYLTHFNCGDTEKEEGVRHFTLIAEENQIINISNIGHQFNAWTFNGTVPGPTMRMVEGDHVKITV